MTDEPPGEIRARPAVPSAGVPPGAPAAPSPSAPAAPASGAAPGGLSVQGTAIVGAGLVVSQVLAMLQMLIVSRLLGPEQFGAFGALAVILLLGSTAMAAAQVVIARHVASGRSSDHVGTGAVLLVGALTCALTLALSPVLMPALNLSGVFGLVLVGATFIPYTVTGAQLGLLQGAERHKRLAALYIVASGARVGCAVVGAAVGGTSDSTLVGLALGATLGAVVGQFLLVGQPPWGSREEGPREFLTEVGHAAHALVALYALTNLDVLLARAQLPAHDAGLYAAGALIARAVFFLPQAILVAAFPRMVAGSSNAQKQALVAVAGIGLLATLVVAAVPDLIVGIMSGSRYLDVAPDAWIFAMAGAGFGVVQVLLYARMAHHDRRATLLLWSGVAALAALGLWLGTSIHALVTVAAVVAWAVALGGLIWARANSAADVGQPADEPLVTPPA